MPYAKVHKVNSARKNILDEDGKILVKKGQSYWFWKFKYRKKQVRLYEPKPEEVDNGYRNEYDEKIKEFNERKDAIEGSEEPESMRDELVNDIEDFKDELQGRLDNIPDQLQESSILNERIEELEQLLDDVDSLEFEESEED